MADFSGNTQYFDNAPNSGGGDALASFLTSFTASKEKQFEDRKMADKLKMLMDFKERELQQTKELKQEEMRNTLRDRQITMGGAHIDANGNFVIDEMFDKNGKISAEKRIKFISDLVPKLIAQGKTEDEAYSYANYILDEQTKSPDVKIKEQQDKIDAEQALAKQASVAAEEKAKKKKFSVSDALIGLGGLATAGGAAAAKYYGQYAKPLGAISADFASLASSPVGRVASKLGPFAAYTAPLMAPSMGRDFGNSAYNLLHPAEAEALQAQRAQQGAIGVPMPAVTDGKPAWEDYYRKVYSNKNTTGQAR